MSSTVSGSSPTATAKVDKPTGPPPNLFTNASKTDLSILSKPLSSISNKLKAFLAISKSTFPLELT
jgi:hypothetical protein